MSTVMTVLVVDDDLFTAELIGMTLEMGGFEVLLAEGGIDALEKLSENRNIALVVSDMNMPVIDGIQLFSEMREQGFVQPFVLLTGEDAEPLRQRYPGMDAVVTKDEQLQENLPELAATMLAQARGQHHE